MILTISPAPVIGWAVADSGQILDSGAYGQSGWNTHTRVTRASEWIAQHYPDLIAIENRDTTDKTYGLLRDLFRSYAERRNIRLVSVTPHEWKSCASGPQTTPKSLRSVAHRAHARSAPAHTSHAVAICMARLLLERSEGPVPPCQTDAPR